MIQTSVVGNYPKLPSQEGDINIRRMLHKFDRKKITKDELNSAFDDVTRRVLNEQLAAGINLPTDGQIRWDDIVTPLAAKADGFEISGLIRWFDNNVLYRKPQIVSPVRWVTPITRETWTFAHNTAQRPVKTVLPAPFSFSQLSDDRYYHDESTLIADLVALLRAEVKSLIDAGAEYIQFDEPSLQYAPDKIELAADALNEVVEGLNVTFWLCFYFGPIEKITAKIDKFNVQVVAADCVSHSKNLGHLLSIDSGKNICCGLLEARNIKLEDEQALQKQYEQISAKFPDAYISPSCGLEFLPHINALEKINLLGRSVRRFNGGNDA